MCGIAGCISGDGTASAVPIDAVLKQVTHRGPDGEGVWSDQWCCLGHRRLAIIDLSQAAANPLSNEDGSIQITFNGEIYNFQKLRAELESLGHRFSSQTDTEVIVHGYEQWGTDCLSRFRGMFAFGLWDQRKKRLLLARDRVGKKPLFFSVKGRSLYFASEIQAMLEFPGISREVERSAMLEYLSWGFIPPPRTGFQDISKLPPGHFLVADLSGGDLSVTTERYWSLSYEPKFRGSLEEASEDLRDTLTQAVRLRLISDVPLGAFLSGGIDSSIVVGLMAEQSSQPVKTFSIGFDEARFDELAHARRIAQRWGTDHHEHVVRPDALAILPMLVRHYGEPYADSSAIPTFYVSKMTRQSVTVALNGDGGDESFAGYERYLANRRAQQLARLPGAGLASRALARMLPDSGDPKDRVRRVHRFLKVAHQSQPDRYGRWLGYFTPDDKQELCEPSFYGEAPTRSGWFDDLFEDTAGLDPVDAAMAVDVRSYLPFDLLVKVDIAAMANSLEARSPFLDHEVMELAARLPVNFKLRGNQGKHILRESFRDLLPTENVRRPKMGFGVPVGEWFRGSLRELLLDCLLSEQSRRRGYFRPPVVQRLVARHLQGTADHTGQLWNLLMLEMWHREMVD